MLKQILNSRILLVFTIPLVLGLLSVFSFQPFNITFINFLIIPIFFLILSDINKRSKNKYRKKPYLKNLFFVGYLFGIGFFLSGTYWISYSLTFDENLKLLIPFSIILIPFTLGLFFGLASLIGGPFIKNNYSSFFLFCFVFSLTDYLRGNILSGFPWNLWSYSWSWLVEIIQVLNPIGLYAFNLISITFFCSPVILFFNNKYKYFVFSIFLLIFFSFYIFGSYKVNKDQMKVKGIKKTAYVKVISPNFEMRYISSDKEIEETIKKMIKYSDPDPNKETIFIWPEGIFAGVYLEDLKKFASIFSKNFSKKHILIFGINTQDFYSEKFYNSLIASNHNLEVVYKYNKKKLVPFGEFIPFNNLFENIGFKKITQGYGSFSKGSKQKNFLINDLNILPLICYEIIFPKLLEFSDQKTNMIINISEDAWFGNSIGPYQHFSKAIFRSVENNTFLARSANKGISTFINNNGKIIKRLEPHETGNIELEVPLINNNLKNKNDLIFFVLLFTYLSIFLLFRNKN
ncbi:MAG: apolipoprotein N-acyltransferase [Candidatus Pelagibacter sp. TMED273]|nr:MAG: apolipoprotein N-acyltransferase [Candidatus Pelagibacter sp. TMED273]|tara:strand:- start:89 stop:1639 length:1551 start_codon:yes stop_codon:yes gene_type:complete